MWAFGIAVRTPLFNDHLGLLEAVEGFAVKQFAGIDDLARHLV